jgi:hypothetical protein
MKFIASKENMTGHFFTPKWADFLRRNRIREELSEISPFTDPVDLVQWIPAEKVQANDYNPNQLL